MRGGGNPPHLSLALAGRLVRRFGSIVLVLPRPVHHGRHDCAVRRRVTAQLVGDQTELPGLFTDTPHRARWKRPLVLGVQSFVERILPQGD